LRQLALLLARRARVDTPAHRVAELRGELAVALAGVAARTRRHLGGQQAGDEAVLVGGPHGAVLATEGGTRALLSAKTERAGEQAVDVPLEADRHFVHRAAEAFRDAVDHLTAHRGLADRGLR